MLFPNVFCVCFLVLLAREIKTNDEINSDTEKPESLFADVIKNISRVNNELQDLINNYEQFKKTQYSLENFDDTESDAEGGRVNRNSKYSVGTKRDTSVKTSTTYKYHTEMIYVEGKSNEQEESSESERSNQSQLGNEVQKSREVEPRKPVEKNKKLKLKVPKTTTKVSVANVDSFESKEETEPNNQEFSDIHKKAKIKPAVIKEAVQQVTKKTKYSKKEKQTKYLSHNSSESDSSVDTERHTEDEEVRLNKPKERAYEQRNDVAAVTAGIYLRSQGNQTNDNRTIKLILNNKNVNNLSLEFTDDDEAFSKDLFKTRVLREAYGDACLKLVLKKCYRACKSAFTTSCRAFKCKSEMKKYFETRSRTGCIDAFNASSKGEDSFGLRRIVTPPGDKDEVMTREVYLTVACQTQIVKPTRRMSNITSIKNGEPINVLRDRYEKACQKISKNKCVSACQSAHSATCGKYECTNRFKKNLKRYCKLECKKAYTNKVNKSRGSSSTSSSSDSDSDSSDDSDDDSLSSDDDTS